MNLGFAPYGQWISVNEEELSKEDRERLMGTDATIWELTPEKLEPSTKPLVEGAVPMPGLPVAEGIGPEGREEAERIFKDMDAMAGVAMRQGGSSVRTAMQERLVDPVRLLRRYEALPEADRLPGVTPQDFGRMLRELYDQEIAAA